MVLKSAVRYDYANRAPFCPQCDGFGIPWQGWFTCACCDAVALISTGEVFVPMPNFIGEGI